MEHLTEIPYYKKDFEKLAEDLGNLRYDSLALFLEHLSLKLKKDFEADLKKDRFQLAKHLSRCSSYLKTAAKNIYNAWIICKPYMKEKK